MSGAVQPELRFTYGDYVKWPDDERWELIDGVPYNMSPAPSRRHQDVLGALFTQIYNQLSDRTCRVYPAPFDVRLPAGNEADDQVPTVVQPDISVICDPAKLDDKGCRGAPDLLLEIISPSTSVKDQVIKLELYERHGVREYWLVHPQDGVVTIRRLGPDGKYGVPLVVEGKGRHEVAVLPGLALDLDAAFRQG